MAFDLYVRVVGLFAALLGVSLQIYVQIPAARRISYIHENFAVCEIDELRRLLDKGGSCDDRVEFLEIWNSGNASLKKEVGEKILTVEFDGRNRAHVLNVKTVTARDDFSIRLSKTGVLIDKMFFDQGDGLILALIGVDGPQTITQKFGRDVLLKEERVPQLRSLFDRFGEAAFISFLLFAPVFFFGTKILSAIECNVEKRRVEGGMARYSRLESFILNSVLAYELLVILAGILVFLTNERSSVADNLPPIEWDLRRLDYSAATYVK